MDKLINQKIADLATVLSTQEITVSQSHTEVDHLATGMTQIWCLSLPYSGRPQDWATTFYEACWVTINAISGIAIDNNHRAVGPLEGPGDGTPWHIMWHSKELQTSIHMVLSDLSFAVHYVTVEI